MIATPKRKLYLHIGYHKTGTTAIQACLAENKRLFLKHGYHYPQIDPNDEERHHHHNIAWQVRNHKRYSPQDGKIDDLLREIERVRAPRVIISSEEFSQSNLPEIRKLAQVFEAYDVTVIVYLRRQDQYLQAVWAQGVKSGKQYDRFTDWLEKKVFEQAISGTPTKDRRSIWVRLNYWQTIADWASVFGEGNIRVRPYERSQLPPNILVDFLQTCDLEDTQWVPDTDQRNVTASLKTLETIRYILAKLKYEIGEDDRFRALFTARLREKAEELGWNDQKMNLITPEIYQRIMCHFTESNQKIARLYLNRDELFLEDFVEKPITTFDINDLTADEAMAFVGPAFAETLYYATYGAPEFEPRWNSTLSQSLNKFRVRYLHPSRTLSKIYRRIFRSMT